VDLFGISTTLLALIAVSTLAAVLLLLAWLAWRRPRRRLGLRAVPRRRPAAR
jgi:hypothetical protein